MAEKWPGLGIQAQDNLTPWQQRILDQSEQYLQVARGYNRLAGSQGGHVHDRACRSRGGNLYCPSPVEPDAIVDPPRPQPLTERERWSTWVLRFGACQMEYELADSPTGRGLATYAVGRVSPTVLILGGLR